MMGTFLMGNLKSSRKPEQGNQNKHVGLEGQVQRQTHSSMAAIFSWRASRTLEHARPDYCSQRL